MNKSKSYKIHKRSLFDNNFKTDFDQCVSHLKSDIEITKNNFYSSLINSCEGYTSLQWKVVNILTGVGDKVV